MLKLMISFDQLITSFVYNNQQLDYLSSETGKVRFSDSGESLHVHDLKDHLGNVRVSFVKGASGVAEVI